MKLASEPTQIVRATALLLVVPLLLAGCSAPEDAADSKPQAPPPNPRTTISAAEATQTLRVAAAAGRNEEVRRALEAGADVEAVGAEGRTVLMLAAFEGHTDSVRLLLDSGAPVDHRDPAGRTPLMYASSGPFAATVELLLEFGAAPDAADSGEGWTALMFAAGEGQAEVVRMLLNYGADPALVDTDGDVARDHALRNDHQEVARLLVASE